MRRVCGYGSGFSFAVAAGPAVAQWAEGPSYVLRVHVTDRERQIPVLAGMSLDLAGIDVKADTADFAGGEDTYWKLVDCGLRS
jgi:hypothetical protein